MKFCAVLVPPAVVTVTLRAPAVAAAPMTRLVVSDVALATVTVPTVTPVPDTATVAPETKLVPVSVTGTVAPTVPLDGAMVVSVGAGGLIVNV
ncbi:MAG TPA: hypothetical protein VK636_18225 [Gemmatimonadaceae bacterium]|nr:hypothetical protein [Gemmatimonadaceae bacterium]